MNYQQAAAKMDAGVDLHLGDSIMYSTDGGATFAEVKGRAFPMDDEEDYAGRKIQAGPRRWRVKLNRTIVGKPLSSHRLRCDLMGEGTFRPSARAPAVEGRYYLFEVEAL